MKNEKKWAGSYQELADTISISSKSVSNSLRKAQKHKLISFEKYSRGQEKIDGRTVNTFNFKPSSRFMNLLVEDAPSTLTIETLREWSKEKCPIYYLSSSRNMCVFIYNDEWFIFYSPPKPLKDLSEDELEEWEDRSMIDRGLFKPVSNSTVLSAAEENNVPIISYNFWKL